MASAACWFTATSFDLYSLDGSDCFEQSDLLFADKIHLMCRLLIATHPHDASALLNSFADMARTSEVTPGKWQGDGCGIAWQDAQRKWHVTKSLDPIWQTRAVFEQIKDARCVVAHARSASFDRSIGDVSVNQPYLDQRYAFVFNGVLRGVRFAPSVNGAIGAQKIWHLLQSYLIVGAPLEALERLRVWLIAHAREITACNIGLTDGDHIYALSMFATRREYYNLRASHINDNALLVSEPIQHTHSEWIESNRALKI